jgi:uncharacterized coiled-coil DUF342 family protein
MHRIVFVSLGVLETLVAVVLLVFACSLPSSQVVADKIGRVERVGKQTSAQVRTLQGHLEVLRDRQPQMRSLADRLMAQLDRVNEVLQNQKIDYGTLSTMRNALGDAARGLDGLGETLDADRIGQLGSSLKLTADLLDKKVVPAATEAAGRLEKATSDLRTDAKRLSELVKIAPLDLKAAREIHASLGNFEQGLAKVQDGFKVQQIETMKEGFEGLEKALTTGAEQVEKLAGYTYPLVTFDGFKPMIEQKQFWPDGDTIAEGMRKAAKGATAAAKQVDAVAEGLPGLRSSLQESRKAVARTRETLGEVLKQQDKVEPLLKDIPQHAARLAEELPQLGDGLAKVLRETDSLKKVAGMLRQSGEGIDGMVQRWPALRKDLGRSADLLRATQKQLTYALDHRAEYEKSLKQSMVLAQAVSAAVPLLTNRLEQDLEEQEQALERLSSGINDVTESLPDLAHTASGVVRMTWLLMVLLAGIFGLHGGYLMFGQHHSRVDVPRTE